MYGSQEFGVADIENVILKHKITGYGIQNSKTSAGDTKSLFRIASITKAITSLRILMLIDSGYLMFSTKIKDLALGIPYIDDRIGEITIDNLLNHTSGWDTAIGFDISVDGVTYHISDPQYDLVKVCNSPTDIINLVFQFPLNHNPSSKFSYSNFGYNILGRIIEKKTSKSYENSIIDDIFTPSGLLPQEYYLASSSSIKFRHPNEVFYDDKSADTEYSLYDDIKFKVPLSYGGSFDLGLMDSHGGWVTSVEGLAKLVPLFVNITKKFPGSIGMRQINNSPRILVHNGALTYGTGGVFAFSETGEYAITLMNHYNSNVVHDIEKLSLKSLQLHT